MDEQKKKTNEEEKNIEYGYGRVSSKSQNLDRQIRQLLAQGIKKENIYTDKYTGATISRPRFQALLRKVKPGDVIFIDSFDRLGRNYDETVEVWNFLTKKRGINIVVLDFELLDTREKSCGEMGKFLQDLVVQVLAYLADAERKKNRRAQREGIEAKKARGEWEDYGRPKAMGKKEFIQRYYNALEGNITRDALIKELGVSSSTFFRYKKMYIDEKNLEVVAAS